MDCADHRNSEFAHCPQCLALYWKTQYEILAAAPRPEAVHGKQLWALISQATAVTQGVLEIHGGCWDTLHECLNCGNRSEEREGEEGGTVEILTHKPDCPLELKQKAVAALRELAKLPKRPEQPAPRPVPSEETGWLIENGGAAQTLYRFINNDMGMSIEWTPDPDKALRFARKEDAQAFAYHDEDAARIAEHMWCGDAPRPVPTAIPTSERLPTEADAESSERHCMNCAEHGECRPNNTRGCGYEPE